MKFAGCHLLSAIGLSLILAAGCAGMQPKPAVESAQSLAENRRDGEWRLTPAWIGTLQASRRSGMYRTFAKPVPEERVLFNALVIASGETWLGCIRKDGLFRSKADPQCRLVDKLPELDRVQKCDTLDHLIELLGAPTQPTGKPWGGERKCTTIGWRLFAFNDDGRIRILTVSAIVSRDQYDPAWRMEGLLWREGTAIPSYTVGTDAP